jgi:hypothetical protein
MARRHSVAMRASGGVVIVITSCRSVVQPTITVRLEPPLRLYVERRAKRERRTLSATVAMLVAAALEQDTAPEASR